MKRGRRRKGGTVVRDDDHDDVGDDDAGTARTTTRTRKRGRVGRGGDVSAGSAAKGDEPGTSGRAARRGRGTAGMAAGTAVGDGGVGDEEGGGSAENENEGVVATAGVGGGDGDGDGERMEATVAAKEKSTARKGGRRGSGDASPSRTKKVRASAAAVKGVGGTGGGKGKRKSKASSSDPDPPVAPSPHHPPPDPAGVRRGTRTRTKTRRLADEAPPVAQSVGREDDDAEEDDEEDEDREESSDDGGSESDEGYVEEMGADAGGDCEEEDEDEGSVEENDRTDGDSSEGSRKRPRDGSPDENNADVKSKASSKSESKKSTASNKSKSKTPRRSKRKGGGAKRKRKVRNRGSLRERTCPYCSKVYSSVHGLAYHIKHRVCKREADEMAAFGAAKGKRSSSAARASGKSVFPAILPGARFVTPYGVVQVVSDSRAPDDHGATAPPKKSVTRAKRQSAQRLREDVGEWRRMALQQVAFHRKRRVRLRELYWKKGRWGIDEEVAAREQRELSAPDGGGHPGGRKPPGAKVLRKEQVPPGVPRDDVPRDSYPDRIVECIMVRDTRKRIGTADEEDDCDNMMKSATCAAVVTEALAESKRKDRKKIGEGRSNDDNGGFHVFLRRRMLTTLFNPDIPVYKCTQCGKQFNSKVGLIGHIDAKVCTKHRDVRDIFAYEKKEKRAEEERKVQALMASMERSHSRPSIGSSKAVYHGAMRSLGFIYSNDRRMARQRKAVNYAKMLLGYEVKSGDSEEGEAVVTEASENENGMKQPVPSNRPVASKKKHDNSSAEKSWPPKRVTGANPKNLPNRQAPKVVDDMADIVKAVDSGRYRSMKRYHGEHSNICAVFGCKFETTLYCCEFCSNVEHLECLKKKVILTDYRPEEEDFVCHTCIQYVLSQRRRNARRLERKGEQRKKAGITVPGTPVAAKAMANDATKDTAHHSKSTGNKKIHKIRGKTALKFNPSRCAAYPEVLLSLSLSYTLKKALNTRVKQRKRTRPVGGDVAHNESQNGKNEQNIDTASTVSKPSAVAPMVIDTMVLVEEVDAGRYPSMKRFNGDYEENCVLCDRGTGELYGCGFCSNVSHMECIKERFNMREIEDDDDFMCHRCIGVVLARRTRAEKRRIQKRDEALTKAGIMVAGSELDGNETILSPGKLAIRTGAASSVTAFEREVHVQLDDLDSYAASYSNSCPTGGPSGLICCAQCTASYSRYLSETAKEMETQTVAKVGREVSEMLQLLNDAKMRLQQALEVAEDNDARRSTFGVSEVSVSLPQRRTYNGVATSRVMDISDIGFDG